MAKKSKVCYVYCHVCKKVLFKGPTEEAIKFTSTMPCWTEHKHTHTFGEKWYFDSYFPDVNLEN